MRPGTGKPGDVLAHWPEGASYTFTRDQLAVVVDGYLMSAAEGIRQWLHDPHNHAPSPAAYPAVYVRDLVEFMDSLHDPPQRDRPAPQFGSEEAGMTEERSREWLTLEELVRAMAAITDRNLGTVVTINSYRTHTGDAFSAGGKAEWNGPLAHEIRVKLAVTENYVDAADMARVVADLEAMGFNAYFTNGGYDEGYLHIGVGRQGRRVLTVPRP